MLNGLPAAVRVGNESHASQITERYPVVGLDSDALDAARLLAERLQRAATLLGRALKTPREQLDLSLALRAFELLANPAE